MEWTQTLPAPLPSNVSGATVTLLDPMQQIECDPWLGHATKVERLKALRARIAAPIADTRRGTTAHSGLSPDLVRKQQVLAELLGREGPMLQPLE